MIPSTRPFETDCRIFTTLFGLILTHLFDWHSLKLFFKGSGRRSKNKVQLGFYHSFYYYRHRMLPSEEAKYLQSKVNELENKRIEEKTAKG